ncbi:MAG: hypothetical protein E6H79_14660, partial [Betaproteobacteria bacterium]
YVFPNGRRVHTTYWRCCKSSGAMALEELPEVAVQLTGEREISVQLHGPGTATLPLPDGEVRLEQITRYPFDGEVSLRVWPARPVEFTLRVRVPSWALGASARLNGSALDAAVEPGTYLACTRAWQAGDELTLNFPMQVQLHRRASRNVQESRAPDGSPVRQEVLHFDYAAVTRGPLVYATELIDGFKTEESLRLPEQPLSQWLQVVDDDALRMSPLGRDALTFQPYYRAGGREHGAWRLTWMSVAPPRTLPFTEEPPQD